MPGILLAPVLSEGLIIKNVVYGKLRRRNRCHLWRFRRQKRDYVDIGHIDKGE